MAALSPTAAADGVLRVALRCNGQDVSDAVEILSIQVRRAINQVPSASLVLRDGDMPNQTFPCSDADTFVPGTEVEVRAGYGDSTQTIFKGIVVRQAVQIQGDNDSRLTLECRDPAIRLTAGQRSRVWADTTDGAVLEDLIQGHGLRASVQATTVQRRSLVQHGCTDWDFLLARAAANGLLVVPQDGTLNVTAPDTAQASALEVSWGVDIIDFHAELEARDLTQPFQQHRGRVRGYVRFQGSALAQVGAMVSLKGVGDRFKGDVLTTALTHHLADGTWLTDLTFGQPAPPAAEPVPGIEGLHVGVVVKLEGDPQGQHRVQVNVPAAGLEGLWAPLAQVQASSGFGAFFVPELGDEVLLGWLSQDPTCPVVLGSLYSSQRQPPYELRDDNPTRAIVTRCKSRLEFNDADQLIALTTPGNNRVVISDKDRCITLTDQNGNRVELAPGGVTLHSPKDVHISAKGHLTLDAVGGVAIRSPGDVTLDGLNVHCSAQVGFAGKGAATAELSASGQTTVKGGMVMIN